MFREVGHWPKKRWKRHPRPNPPLKSSRFPCHCQYFYMYSATWCNIVTHCATWSHMVPHGHVLQFRVWPYGTILSHMVPCGQKSELAFRVAWTIICQLCNLECMGDEFHYLFICPAFKDDRSKFIPVYFRKKPNTLKMSQWVLVNIIKL